MYCSDPGRLLRPPLIGQSTCMFSDFGMSYRMLKMEWTLVVHGPKLNPAATINCMTLGKLLTLLEPQVHTKKQGQ